MSTVPPTRPTEDLERLQALAESGAAELGWDAVSYTHLRAHET